MSTRAVRDHGTAIPSARNRATASAVRLAATDALRPDTDSEVERVIAETATTATEAAEMRRHVSTIRVRVEERERLAEGLDRMLAGEPGGFNSIKRAWTVITGAMRFEPVLAWSELERRGYASDLRESVDSGSWSVMLGDALHRAIVAEYQAAPGWDLWRRLVSSSRFGCDFRVQRVARIGGYGSLPTVAEGAPYQPLPTPSDEDAGTYAPTKRGGLEYLTLEMVANDDVAALQRVVRTLGRSAAATLTRFTTALITTNPLMAGDGIALFDAAHANTATSPLSATALAAGRVAMRQQTALGDPTDVLGAAPSMLVVGPALEALARELTAPDTPGRDLEVLVVPHWTSATAWYVVGDTLSVPTVELGFTGTTDLPTITIARDDANAEGMFSTDQLAVRVSHAYGGTVVDHRGLYRGNA